MTVRWGLLGCGDIAYKRVARAIIDSPNSKLVAACRRNQARLQDFCRKFQVEKAYSKEEDLINDNDLDAVYIATPVNLHLPQTLAAARAGKHVLVEKPMAMSVDECRQMISECQKQGALLGVAYYRRFYPIVRRMKEILVSGEIGKPMSISAITSTPFALNPGEDGYWRVILGEGGGGALMDVGSHRINLFLDLFGPIANVKAFSSTLAGDYEGEDCASLVMQFRSGAQGNLQCFFRTDVIADDFSILGTKGRLTATPLNGDKLIVELGDNAKEEFHPPAENLHEPLVADFVTAITEGRSSLVTGEEGILTNKVMELAYADESA